MLVGCGFTMLCNMCTLCICIMHLAGFDRGLILDIGMVVNLDVEGSGLGLVGRMQVWFG